MITRQWILGVINQINEQVKLGNGNSQQLIYIMVKDLRSLLQLAEKALPAESPNFYQVTTGRKDLPKLEPALPVEPRKDGHSYLNEILILPSAKSAP